LTEFDKETEDLVNCALAYRKLGKGEPLYYSREEVIKQWARYGAHADQAIYQDLFRRLPYDLDTNMAPLSKKVA
jgi:hypothetical protein